MQLTVCWSAAEPMETSENDQKDNSLDNPTDKENIENGNKKFATKDPDRKYDRKNPRSSREISTSRGTITIHTHSVRKVHRKKRSFKCLWCSDVFTALKDFDKHVKDKHPDVKYTCRFCSREFQSFTCHQGTFVSTVINYSILTVICRNTGNIILVRV